jgi:NADH dehydrogenase (ubiquinone) 1 alpha subcomplex subunit 8
MKGACADEFTAQWKCLASSNLEYKKCRNTQNTMDNCVFEKMGLTGAFRTYETDRFGSHYD